MSSRQLLILTAFAGVASFLAMDIYFPENRPAPLAISECGTTASQKEAADCLHIVDSEAPKFGGF